MRVYETTFILSPQADDATFDRQIKSVTELVNRFKGKILEEDRWGIRRLTYPIQKYTQGYYTRLVFEANNNVLNEMERFFKLEEPFIRHLTVVFESTLINEPSSDKEAPRKAPQPKVDSAPAGKPIVEKPKEEKPVEPAIEKTEAPKEEKLPESEKPDESSTPEDK